MSSWSVSEANAAFSRAGYAVEEEPPLVTLRGLRVAAGVSPQEYRCLRKGQWNNTLYEVLTSAPKVPQPEVLPRA